MHAVTELQSFRKPGAETEAENVDPISESVTASFCPLGPSSADSNRANGIEQKARTLWGDLRGADKSLERPGKRLCHFHQDLSTRCAGSQLTIFTTGALRIVTRMMFSEMPSADTTVMTETSGFAQCLETLGPLATALRRLAWWRDVRCSCANLLLQLSDCTGQLSRIWAQGTVCFAVRASGLERLQQISLCLSRQRLTFAAKLWSQAGHHTNSVVGVARRRTPEAMVMSQI